MLSIFAEKFDVDDRVPFFVFHLPVVDEAFGILPIKWMLWAQVISLLLSQVAMSAIMAVVAYKFIVQRQGTSTAYVTGFGIVIPVVLLSPFWILAALDIRSKMLSMTLILTPCTVTFRCMEAMFGFTPPAAGKSLKNYVLYYASLMDTKFDPSTQEPIRASFDHLVFLAMEYTLQVIILSLLLSFAAPFDFAPFETRVAAHSVDHNLADIFHVNHLMNNFVGAVLVSIQLSCSTVGVSLLFSLLSGGRIITSRVVKNPMFGSESPSDFWGRRWNTLVHGVLKRGIFKPVRKYSSKAVAVIATFVASGAIHEYVWAILFFVHEHRKDETGICPDCFYPVYGKSIVFFGWNGALVVLESLLGGLWLVQWTKKTLPKPLITALVVMTALPVGHLFTGDWIEGDYFSHLQLGFPVIVRVR